MTVVECASAAASGESRTSYGDMVSHIEKIASNVYDEFVVRGWLSDPDDGDIAADRDLEFFTEVERRSRVGGEPSPERPASA